MERTRDMNHEESKLQQQCVAWFRAQYPQYAMLLTHPINEGNRNTRTQGAIHKAEGTVAGVADLLLFMPAKFWNGKRACFGLGIEMKRKTGKQSQGQKEWEKSFTAAGYGYVVVRCFDDFRKIINDYIAHVPESIRIEVASAHVEIEQERTAREKKKFLKVIGKYTR